MTPIPSEHGETDEVLMEQKSSVQIVTLNRPKKLNAISMTMASRLLELYITWEKDSSIKLIILKGKGRAFSCGGDVAALVPYIAHGDWKAIADYYRASHSLFYVIATYNIPQVCFMDGIAMGGGGNLAATGRFRVATENSLFAMPEVALGTFPDSGASYFLSRLPGYLGVYLGLTGARLDGAEMLACGLATHFVQAQKLSLLEEALIQVDSSDLSVISSVIAKFSHTPTLKMNSACHNRGLDVISKCFSKRSVEDIIAALETEADEKDNWINWAIQSMKKASPTSLKITLRSARNVGRCRKVCLLIFQTAGHVTKGKISRDFVEGCRAILLDKDNNPKWNPSKLESVSNEMVDCYFSKVDDGDWDDLKLPGCRAMLLDKDNNPRWNPSKLESVSNEMVDCYFSKADDGDWDDLKLPVRPNITNTLVLPRL